MNNSELHTDKQLFELISQGDEQGFKVLFQRHFQNLYSVMLQYTKIPSDAEDIVQSAFLKLWEKRESLGSVRKPDSWLFIIARNDFLNRFEKLSSEANYRNYVKEIFEDEWGSPEELLITRQSREIIRQALDNLPQKQKEAFSLSRIDGLSYAQIAEVMGVGRATVKEHIARATQSVVLFLKKHKDSLISVVIALLMIADFI